MPGEQRIFCGGCAVGAGHARPAAFPQTRFYLSVAGRTCPAPTTLWIFREGHPYGRPGADLTLQVDARIVQKGNVLDDRKAQTGAAGRLGAALVHAVEPLKHAGLAVLRDADAIFREEMALAGLDRTTSQYFAVLTDLRSVGVMGDERTYDYTLALRAVQSQDFMTATWSRLPYELLDKISGRIIGEVKHINRIVYDITSKPPATVEWE